MDIQRGELRMQRAHGFTLLEVLFAAAIVGILVAIAYPFYRDYQARARASDIVLKYDGVRAGIGSELAQGSTDNCGDLAARINQANLKDTYAKLAIGFERIPAGGYRAVLSVCADAAQEGALGVAVTREAYEVFSKTNRVEQGAVLTSTLVSFAVPLSSADLIACKVALANSPAQCGSAAATTPLTAPTVVAPAVTTPPITTPAVTTPPAATQCPEGSEPVKAEDASYRPTVVCLPKCAAAQIRNEYLKCVSAPAGSTATTTGPAGTQPPAVGVPQPAGQAATGSQSAASSSSSQSTTSGTPARTPEQCKAQCRERYPHGNSRAYRDCISACG